MSAKHSFYIELWVQSSTMNWLFSRPFWPSFQSCPTIRKVQLWITIVFPQERLKADSHRHSSTNGEAYQYWIGKLLRISLRIAKMYKFLLKGTNHIKDKVMPNEGLDLRLTHHWKTLGNPNQLLDKPPARTHQRLLTLIQLLRVAFTSPIHWRASIVSYTYSTLQTSILIPPPASLVFCSAEGGGVKPKCCHWSVPTSSAENRRLGFLMGVRRSIDDLKCRNYSFAYNNLGERLYKYGNTIDLPRLPLVLDCLTSMSIFDNLTSLFRYKLPSSTSKT